MSDKQKQSQREYDRLYHQRNRERRLKRMAEYNRAYYEANRDRLKMKRCGVSNE